MDEIGMEGEMSRDQKVVKAMALRKKGHSLRQISDRLGVSLSTAFYMTNKRAYHRHCKHLEGNGKARRNGDVDGLVQRVEANCQRWNKILTLLREME